MSKGRTFTGSNLVTYHQLKPPIHRLKNYADLLTTFLLVTCSFIVLYIYKDLLEKVRKNKNPAANMNPDSVIELRVYRFKTIANTPIKDSRYRNRSFCQKVWYIRVLSNAFYHKTDFILNHQVFFPSVTTY